MPSPQKLRLEAEMKDSASPAIRKLREELNGLQAASAETRGVEKLNREIGQLETEAKVNASAAVRKLRAELADLQKSTAENRAISGLNKEIASLRQQSGDVRPTAGMMGFRKWLSEAAGDAKGFLAPISSVPGVLTAIGVGGLAAGVSAASLAAEMKRLGERALDLKELSRETGFSQQFANNWSHAGAHFKVAEDAMQGMLGSFAAQMPDFQRGVGTLFQEFSGAGWGDLIRKMQHEGPAEALMDALRQAEEVGKTKGPQVQKQILESIIPGFGGDAERLFADGGLKGLQEQLSKNWASPSKALGESAQQLRDAVASFNNSLERFENTVGPAFLATLKDIVREAAAAVDVISGGKSSEHGASKAPDHKDHRSIGEVVGDAWHDYSAFMDGLEERLKHGFGHASPDGIDREDGAFHPMSFRGGTSSGLLHNAAFVTGGTGSGTMSGAVSDGARAGVLQAFREAMLEQQIDRAMGGSGRGLPALGGGLGGGYGSGVGSADGAGDGSGGGDQGTPSKSLLDFIAKSEGTKGYDTSLGFGKFLPGGHETDLQGKSLNEILELGRFMRSQPGNPNSSALGRYQMTGETIRDLMGRMHLSGNEKFDASMQDAMASKLIRDEGPHALGRWASLSGVRMRTALGLLKSESIASMPAGDGPPGSMSAAADTAARLHGFGSAEAARALGSKMTPGEWCADFVNGALKGANIRGVQSSVANSFLGWGEEVAKSAMRKGDVLVQDRGRGIGNPGGHAGLASGATRMRNGRMQFEMISGNYGNRVNAHDWVDADRLHVRRATGLSDVAGGAGAGSDHRLTVDLRDPHGVVKSTRLEKRGAMKVEVPNHWQTGRAALIDT